MVTPADEWTTYRIVFREEGDFVAAYFAPGHTMDGAVKVASVKVGALAQTPGAIRDFQMLVLTIFNKAARDLGLTVFKQWTETEQ